MLVFPEGRKGTEKLYKDRYRLRRFGRGGFVEAAMRARHADRPGRRRRRRGGDADLRPHRSAPAPHRADLLPGHAAVPALRPARRRLPARQVPHPLPRADPDRPVGRAAVGRQGARADGRRGDPRADPGGAVRHGLAAAGRCGSDDRGGPHHRRLDLLGRPARAGARARPRRSRRSSASAPTTRPASSSAPSSSASAPSTRCCGGSSTRPRSTRWSTRGWSSTRCRPRRAQAHETNVIGTMNILAACGGPDSPVRKVVFKSSAHYYGCEHDDPAFFTEEMRRPHAPRTRLESDIVEAEKAVDGFAQRNPDVTVTVLRFCNGLGPDLRTTHTRAARACRPCPASSASTRATSSSTRTTSSACCASPSSATCPGIYNAARRRRAGAVGGRLAARASRSAPILPPWGSSLAAAALRPLGLRIPPEVLHQLRYGRGLDNRKLKGSRATRFGYTSREAVLRHAEALRAAAAAARARASRTATSARWRSSCAGARACAGRAPCDASERLQGFLRSARPPTISATTCAPSDRRTRPHRHRAPRGRGRRCTPTTSAGRARGSPTA